MTKDKADKIWMDFSEDERLQIILGLGLDASLARISNSLDGLPPLVSIKIWEHLEKNHV